MRVIAGICKGRRLVAPKGNRTRPALDQVKEAVFNILFDVEGYYVLDLFAGSGSMGIEALSRGATHATFVDNDAASRRAIASNLEACKFERNARILKSNVSTAINRLNKNGKTFDLIFVDPPYLKNYVNQTLESLAETNLLKDDGLVVIEHHPKEPIEAIPGMTLTDTRKYGQTLISFMKKA